MKLRPLSLLVVLAAALVARAEPAATKPALEKGMTAEAILQLAGKPAEVVALKTADGKAEKWIYRRKVGQTVKQSADNQAFETRMIGFGGTGGVQIGPVAVPDYRIKYVVGYQVTALLMVDGKLQLGRQWYEREEKYAD
jgi:hypothetical protein